MVERLAAGAAVEQRARQVDHLRRALALVGNGRAAVGAEAANVTRLVLEPRDRRGALGDAVAPLAMRKRLRQLPT